MNDVTARTRSLPKGVGWGFRQMALGLGVLAAAVPLSQLSTSGALARSTGGLVPVIVRTDAAASTAVERAVHDLGGTVDRHLDLITGLAARMPSGALATLSSIPGVDEVTRDARVRLFSIGTYDPTTDVNSLYNVTTMTGAQAYWQAGYTGQNVDVALLDTGVVPVDGLTAANKVVTGPDLSFDSQYAPLQYLDGYGHGTHMAGIIAGRDDTAPSNPAGDTSDFVGMAPGARIVSVRVGDHTGVADVSQVIAAIDWVVQHRNDNGMHIRVLNLSFGTDSQQAYLLDPLAYAAEQAWKNGIVVVAAAGNGGADSGSVADPAFDPYVIAVGAADTNGTVGTGDDSVATFSSNGSATRNPDLVAPGVHVASLRDPGSYLDSMYGSTADVGTRFFRGSGTSQATAVVSGAAALVISQNPGATPDQVKALLTGTAKSLGQPAAAQGAGELNLTAALARGGSNSSSPSGTVASVASTQAWPPSLGSGTLQGSRGSVVLTANGVPLTGEQDIFGHAFSSATMAAAEGTASSWSGGTWNGGGWSGSGWSGSAWSGKAWATTAWSSNSWSGSSWAPSSWNGNTWSGSGWAGSGWAGSGWAGSGWAGSGWAGSGWARYAWSATTWS